MREARCQTDLRQSGDRRLPRVAARKRARPAGGQGPRKAIKNVPGNGSGPGSGAGVSPDGKLVAWGCEAEEWGTVRVYETAAIVKGGPGSK